MEEIKVENETTFTVLPMNQSISLKPGEVYEGSVKIVNPASSASDFAYTVSATPYGVSNEYYDADLITDSDRTAISKWIKIKEPKGKVKPNETKEINFTIKVPENAPAGGQYATIAISSDNESSSNDGLAVQSIHELASIIYADVDGETIQEGEVLENNIPGFVTSTPITLSALLNNTGNVHSTATFTITATDVFTGQVILPTEENSGRYSEYILPETTRYTERQLDNLPSLGIVKVSQTITYNGQTSTNEKQVFICPVWFLILATITLIAIIVSIVLIIKKHKRRKVSTLQ